MQLIPRSEWQDPKLPVNGSKIIWKTIDTVAIHYTADDDLIDGDPGEDWASIPAYLRAIQKSYETSRGYSVGYNVAVDQRGGAWELRGFDIKCAANKGHNDHTWAILVLVDGTDPASVAAQQTIRELVALAETHADRALAIKGHCQLPASTACPGVGLLGQIIDGVFRPQPAPLPIHDEEDDVKYMHLVAQPDGTRPEVIVAFDGAGVSIIEAASPPDLQALAATYGAIRTAVTPEQFDIIWAKATK